MAVIKCDCGKENDVNAKSCIECGRSFIETEQSSNTIDCSNKKIIKTRSFGKMFILSLFTWFLYSGYFYKQLTDDINSMSEAVGLVAETDKLKFNGIVSSICGSSMAVRLLPFGLNSWSFPFSIGNAIYIWSKTKKMQKQLLKISDFYYEKYSISNTTMAVYSTNLWIMAVIAVVFFMFAPIIFAYKTIEMFNDIAEQHNKYVK